MDRKLTLKLILLRWKVQRMTDFSIISTTGISLSNVPDLKHCLCREIIFIGSSQSGLKLPSDCSWHCRNCSDCRLLLQLQAVIKLQWGLTPVCRQCSAALQCTRVISENYLIKVVPLKKYLIRSSKVFMNVSPQKYLTLPAKIFRI